MIMPKQGHRIVLLVRSLGATGVGVVVVTLCMMGWTLSQLRGQRAGIAARQQSLDDASRRLRLLAVRSEQEIHDTLDETATDRNPESSVLELARFVPAQLASQPDPSVVTPLNDLGALLARLSDLSTQALAWRSKYDRVYEDVRQERTLNHARDLVARLRIAMEGEAGRIRLEQAIQYRRWRGTSGEDATRDAVNLLHQMAALQGTDATELNDQLAELGRLVELLGGAEQFDGLADIKDNHLSQVLTALERSAGRPAEDRPQNAALTPEAIHDIATAIFGKDYLHDTSHQNVTVGRDGLFALRRDDLELRRQREILKTQAEALFQKIDAANADFSQSARIRAVALTEQTEHNLADGWHRLLVFGGACSLLLIWLAWQISRGIRRQVGEIEQSRAAAEDGRKTTQKLMLEQQAAAAELQMVNQKLIEASRSAGMAEIATSVLHNVGNVLNSVNVSVSLARTKIQESPVKQLSAAAALVHENREHLPEFLTTDERGKHMPDFLDAIADVFKTDQESLLREITGLAKNVEHIKQIVAVQQTHAKSAPIIQDANIHELLDDAIKVACPGTAGIDILRRFNAPGPCRTDRHALLQILINLVSNAKHAIADMPFGRRRITLSTRQTDGIISIDVADDGVGIATENLTRIFNHGFTTRKDGHGFGLHSSALAARQLGGALRVASPGSGKGAIFTLELPDTKERVTT